MWSNCQNHHHQVMKTDWYCTLSTNKQQRGLSPPVCHFFYNFYILRVCFRKDERRERLKNFYIFLLPSLFIKFEYSETTTKVSLLKHTLRCLNFWVLIRFVCYIYTSNKFLRFNRILIDSSDWNSNSALL